MKPVGTWKRRSVVGLMLLSGIWFLCLLSIPFSGLAVSTKAILGTVFLLLMEGTFYLGVILAGRQLFSQYWSSMKSRLRNWLNDAL